MEEPLIDDSDDMASASADASAVARARSVVIITGTYPILTTTFIDREIAALRRRGLDINILALRRPAPGRPLSAEQSRTSADVTYLLPVRWSRVVSGHLKFILRRPVVFLTTLYLLLAGHHPSAKSRFRTILHFGEGVVVAAVLSRWRFDEVQAHFVDRAATVALVVSRFLDKPYTISIHAGADVFVDPVLLPEKLAHARAAVTCTNYNREYLSAIVGDEIGSKIASVPHGLDLKQYEPATKTPRDDLILLAVGQLAERKGILQLVDACALLRDRGLQFECRIVGSGPLAGTIDRRIVEVGLAGIVKLLGAVGHDRVIQEYREASLFVLPCVESADGNRDGIPNVIPEAMAMRLPVVSTYVSAIPELVTHGETGLLVEPNDIVSLADALERLMVSKDLRLELGSLGREKVEAAFDLDRNVDELIRTLWPEGGVETKQKAVRWTAIAWAPNSRRSEMFARELGGSLHCIHYLTFRSPLHAPLKYILQGMKTLQVLVRERPDAVHVQNPPFVCGLVVWGFCRAFGSIFVTEFHSAAFGPQWRWALPIQRFLARAAMANIVTSEHWAELVESWGGSTIVMHDPFLDLGAGRDYPMRDGFNLAFVSTFAPDEPVREVVEAAARIRGVNIYITGDDRLRPDDLGPIPPNVIFTGFLDLNTDYLGLLRGADASIVLTTRDHTLQLAGCESISLGKPVITSNWPYLKELFGSAGVYVGPSADEIERGITEMVTRHPELKRNVLATRRRGREVWETKIADLHRIVGLTP